MLGFNSSEEITNLTNYDISDSKIRCEMCIKELWNDMSRKVYLLKELHSLVRALNKPDTRPREEIYAFCKNFITKLTDYFFTIIYVGTASFGNESLQIWDGNIRISKEKIGRKRKATECIYLSG